MELHSINSTTSISDNQDLRNHYEKLLFKNQSEISLPDYPNNVINNNNNNNNNNNHSAGAINRQFDNFSFITGFRNLNIDQTIIPPPTTTTTQDNTFFQLPQDYSKCNNNVPNISYPFNRHLSLQENQQYLNRTQNQNVPWNHNENRRYSSSNTFTTSSPDSSNNLSFNSNGYISHNNPSQLLYPQTHFNHPYPPNMDPNPTNNNNNNNNIIIRKHHSISNGDITISSQTTHKHNEVSIDDGLLLIDGEKIASSNELHQLYETCGNRYFSSNVVYPFVDYIKNLISFEQPDTIHIDPKRRTKIMGFLKILQNCNTDFISQIKNNENQKITNNNIPNHNIQNFSTFQPKDLVLIALKNGKLELLSTTQNTNLQLKRGDLVLVDGDRGKDLVQIVESEISLNLALFANFLKKKVHFDSLITVKDQHYPNDKFIQTLIDSKNGVGEKLNNKLYDIVELTQFVVPSKQVLRFATPWEVTTNLQYKFQDELKALHVVQLKLQNLNSLKNNNNNNGNSQENIINENNNIKKKNLNIKILNAEFQFDRKKLTFYYICEERNDFRELIKELFKYYKTRIWLCAIPNNLNIDSRYYDNSRKELSLYEQMIRSQQFLEPYRNNQFSLYNPTTTSNEPLNVPPLNKIELDNFQIGIYKELLEELF